MGRHEDMRPADHALVPGPASRRSFLRLSMFGAGSLVLAACAGAPSVAPAPTGAAGAPAPEPTAGAPAAPTAASAAARSGSWTASIPAPPKKYDPPITISQNFDINSATQFINGETIEDNVWKRMVKDQLGIDYQVKWAAQGEEAVTQKWATAMAAGDLPEYMVQVNLELYARLRRADQFEDITDIWERTASPLLKEKKGYPDGPLFRVFRDKRVYAVPGTLEVAGNDRLLWIRQDWLDKAGMKVPTTVDELGAVAKAFKAQNPGTFGFSFANEFSTWMSSWDPIFGAFGAMPETWVQGQNNTLIYGGIQPGIKDALNLLRQWYTDGLIDPEFVTTGPDKSVENIAANKAGLFYAPYWANGWPIPDSVKNDANAKWVFVDVAPTGPGGKQGRSGQVLGNVFHGFLKGTDPQKIEAVINQMNWYIERWTNSFKNQDYFTSAYSLMFEGYDYVWEGNDIKVGPTDIGTIMYEGTVGYPTWVYPEILADYIAAIAPVRAKDPQSLNAMERYLTKDPLLKYQQEAYQALAKTTQYQIINQFTGAPTPTMVQSRANLLKLERQVYTEIINGTRPLDAFDQFTKDWMAQGGEQITAEVNEWYRG